jgi:hypothetical protein
MLLSKTNNQVMFYLSAVALAAIGFILVFNMSEIFSGPINETYLSFNDVEGMAIVHHGLPYTLNFKQQTQTIEYLNRALPVGKSDIGDGEPLNFSKLVIYRFNKPALDAVLIGYENNNLIFSVPEWNPNGYIKDVSVGDFKNLLAQTYDP